ncbi:uncharacterized protein LOC143914549 [Arctopsyche grandis]|uniref:uncharacterized protein LOC143914549 n=1 Tax=Arctopsyche grandis TaxID=121162 RepID=UPI00406D8FBF
MYKFLLFAALVAFVSAKPGVVAPLAYSAPVVSTYGAVPAVSAYSAYPAVSAYGAVPAISAYNAVPAISAYNTLPALSAYNTVPALSAYNAYNAYNPLVRSVVAPQVYSANILKSVVSAPVVSAYSAGLPLAYNKYY